MAGNTIQWDKDADGIVTLTMDDPSGSANVMNEAYIESMGKAVDRLVAEKDSITGVVITSAKKTFFAGGDLTSMINAGPEDAGQSFDTVETVKKQLRTLETLGKPVVAAINGAALGGGLEIALACDIRIAKKEGGKIGLPEVNLGVLPGTGGTQRFARAVGRARAIEFMATGRTFSFEEALEMGLIHYIYEKESFWEDVMAYAKQFCPPNKASRAVGRIKRSVVTGSEIPFAEALGLERELQQLLFTSEDAKEGLAAYVEKRAANFKGK